MFLGGGQETSLNYKRSQCESACTTINDDKLHFTSDLKESTLSLKKALFFHYLRVPISLVVLPETFTSHCSKPATVAQLLVLIFIRLPPPHGCSSFKNELRECRIDTTSMQDSKHAAAIYR